MIYLVRCEFGRNYLAEDIDLYTEADNDFFAHKNWLSNRDIYLKERENIKQKCTRDLKSSTHDLEIMVFLAIEVLNLGILRMMGWLKWVITNFVVSINCSFIWIDEKLENLKILRIWLKL